MVAHMGFLGKGSSNLESQGKEGKEELLSASEIKRGWAQRRRDDVSVDIWDAGDLTDEREMAAGQQEALDYATATT
ncbi:hypothetical protein CKAH01_04135 [Colletotrichum kahawae]|uniref:Uncharacterized protein n=1 Tax=Colletotrichum kahawae TaxID=34407 RepID=A0AAE0D9W1_COLKA|nr:hypothetical protein CKAH01_04135 [Colletotrichum kahawae]